MNISGLLLDRSEVKTNARIKGYPQKSVLQVCNSDIFSTGQFEASDGSSLRQYDVPPKGSAEDPARSLEESKRRARSAVADVAMLNRFEYMFTWTLNKDLIDRYDAKEVYEKVRAFLSNKSSRNGFQYILMPELHKDGAIHMHGLCNLGTVPLADSGHFDKAGRQIFNMPSWAWGFSTCVKLDENYERAVNYVTKYITKSEEKIFGKWYLSSRNLKKRPDIVPLQPIDYQEFKVQNDAKECSVFLDVKMLVTEMEPIIFMKDRGIM